MYVVVCLFFLSGVVATASGDPNDNLLVIWRMAGWAQVVTNASTDVEETTATLNGFLIDDGGTTCQYAFEYDTVSGEPYAFSTVWIGPISSPQEFNQNVGLLTNGELYFFRAKAKNANGTSYGNELKFLTKPDHPNNFQAQRNGIVTQIDLTWNIGAGADRTVIVRKVDSYPSDRSDGLLIYNGTGNNYNDGAVVAGVHYYYRAWSYCSKGGLSRFSDEYDEDNCLALAPSVFDIRDISVNDNVIPHLDISVDVLNLGSLIVDITVSWVLVRTDTGTVLDMGADTFGVAGYTTYVYTVYPVTMYVGDVRITFTGDGASAFELFYTQSAIGRGVPKPPKPPEIPGVPEAPPVVPQVEVLFVLLGVILAFIFIMFFFFWKRRGDKERADGR